MTSSIGVTLGTESHFIWWKEALSANKGCLLSVPSGDKGAVVNSWEGVGEANTEKSIRQGVKGAVGKYRQRRQAGKVDFLGLLRAAPESRRINGS